MKEVKEELLKIRKSQIRMEADVKYHIKRTDLLQNKVVPMFAAYTGIKWFIGSVIGIAAVYSALSRMGVI